MPQVKAVKLSSDVQAAIAKAVKETLAIGDCMEIEIKVTAVIYDLKAEGCLQDAEHE